MKILYIVPYVPNLIRVRPYNLIRHLSILGHEVTVAAIWSDPEEQRDIEHLQKNCACVITVQQPATRSLLNSLVALLQRVPMQSRYSWHPALFNLITAILELNQECNSFDVIHVEHLRGIEYGLRLLSWQGNHNGRVILPVVWDSVDCISSLMRQTAQHAGSLKNRAIAGLEVRNTARYECQGLRLFDRVLVTSPLDKIELSNTDQGIESRWKIDVLQNGVDLDYFIPGNTNRHTETIVVSGKMSYHANIAMVQYLVNEIMPLVWARKSDTRLQIVGKDPPQSIQAMSEDPMVTVTGTVSDIRPYLQQATLAVVPITYGTGIQNKILEAMACATPVVVSSHAVSSLLAIPNRDYLAADTARQFSDAIIDLLDDPQKQKKLGLAGREYVEKNHDWYQVASRLVDIYESAVHFRKEMDFT